MSRNPNILCDMCPVQCLDNPEIQRLNNLLRLSELGREEAMKAVMEIAGQRDRARAEAAELAQYMELVRKKYHLSPDVGFEDLAKIRADLLKRLEKAEVALRKVAKLYPDLGLWAYDAEREGDHGRE